MAVSGKENRLMTLKKIVFAFIFALLPFYAAAQDYDGYSPETWLIDAPTAHVRDNYQASFTTRSYADGSVMESLDFGVIPQINIGFSIAVYELIGSSDDIKVLDPDFQVKWKLFDGSLYLPAIAIGYDGRRYGYNRQSKEYMDDRKGGYITLTREIFTPGLNASAGMNLSDFDRHDLYFFLGASWRLNDWLALVGEWDNINNMRDSRLNLGAHINITPALVLSGAVRRIGRGDENERMLQLRYVTNF